ncbi:50S ribosomal protein L6 [Gimesia alba]|uniref:Large ribosomal subunit protein uL6 n=1 Tax=Gimesia alba TaxID=2527973 RepID=A0A517RNM1_9PLAN|nr:50S ribosomal protein L6 [Gimesia alba]QDT45455.1 50S ribosomal protein L6 [Gimesia alba]
MSRIGKKPIPVPSGVEVKIDGGSISIKGKHGELSFTYHPSMQVELDSEANVVNVIRPNEERQSRALHGLTRALIANMVQGVETPFVKKLEIQGVGYQATLNGQKLSLQVGFANTIVLEVPKGVTCELPNSTNIVVTSADKHAVGQFAANIRSVRPPEPYKGKGIRYEGEYVRRKAGKAFAS